MTKLAGLQKAIAYQFADAGLLDLALAHRSVGRNNNERLEFLGDSIVNHVIAQALYEAYPAAREGDLSRMRASLVKGDTLAEVARELGLGEYLVLGSGERKSGGHRRSSILADAFEALIGAVLLDSDVDTCRAVLLPLFESRLSGLEGTDFGGRDAKTQLQEYLQGRRRPLPQYGLKEVTGDDHNQQFLVSCRLQNPELVVEGRGSSRRKAEQDAARAALEACRAS